MDFFRTSTGNLLAAEQAAGVGHHVAVSVVACDRLPDSGYMRAKLAQEELITASSIPYSIVRSTQFYEFVETIAYARHRGRHRSPAGGAHPGDRGRRRGRRRETDRRGRTGGGIVEIAGPEPVPLDELIRQALSARNDRRHVVVDPGAATSAPRWTTPACSRASRRSSETCGSRTGSAGPRSPASGVDWSLLRWRSDLSGRHRGLFGRAGVVIVSAVASLSPVCHANRRRDRADCQST